MKAIGILTTVYAPCWETKLDLWDRQHTGLLLCRGDMKTQVPQRSHTQIALCHTAATPPPPPPPPRPSCSSSVGDYLFPTSCSDVLKKFLTPAIAFHHRSFRLLTGADASSPHMPCTGRNADIQKHTHTCYIYHRDKEGGQVLKMYIYIAYIFL